MRDALARLLLVLADLHQGLAVDGVLRIPLADIARKHLSRHPSDFAVVQLQAPITVMAFDGTLRNETEFVYFKPPASANTTGTGAACCSRRSKCVLAVRGCPFAAAAVHCSGCPYAKAGDRRRADDLRRA